MLGVFQTIHCEKYLLLLYIYVFYKTTIDSYSKEPIDKQLLSEKEDLNSDRIHSINIIVRKII